ncbi:uncharacterized protein LOC116132327 [Pistacia vera]|uniref:uncharacterized protein LOC116132327 n=1 Tax=Pistacia vera TaxID=55513 RepID=UPI001263AFF3|nr:uncharacterized protein LOC116132327 [Pistacia vera]
MEKLANLSSTQVSIFSSTLQVITPKLTKNNYKDNYRFWRSQVLSAVGAHELEDHLTGSIPCPDLIIVSDNDSSSQSSETLTKEKINPAYVAWKKTNKFLVTWLLASISESRALHLRNLLQTTQKGSMNVSEFVKKMKSFAENLSGSGQVISDEDLLQYVLDGLGPEFDAVVVNLTSRIESKFDSVSLQEAQFLLQKYEMRLE